MSSFPNFQSIKLNLIGKLCVKDVSESSVHASSYLENFKNVYFSLFLRFSFQLSASVSVSTFQFGHCSVSVFFFYFVIGNDLMCSEFCMR